VPACSKQAQKVADLKSEVADLKPNPEPIDLAFHRRAN